MNAREELELETLIDKHGLGEVIDAIARICGEKAEHIRSNYDDDDPDADAWDDVGDSLSNFDTEGL